MKKTLLVATLLLAGASSAFGTALNSGGVTSAGAAILGAAGAPTPMVKLSTGVNGGATYNTAAYSIYTKHTNGSKVFGTANDSTSMYFKAAGNGPLATSNFDTSVSGNAAFDNSWSTY